MLEYKGVDVIRVKNRIRLFITGNPNWLIPAGLKERRFAIFDMGEEHLQDHDYFKAIDDQMANGGRADPLLHYLLDFDLSTVNLRQISKTAALLEQQIESLPPEEAWWLDTLMRGVLPVIRIEHRIDDRHYATYEDHCTKELVHQSYVRHAQLQGIPRRSTETKLAIFLKAQLGPELKSTRPTIQAEQTPCHVFPPLVHCRRIFARKARAASRLGLGGLGNRGLAAPATGGVLSRIAQLDQRTALPDQCLHSAEADVRPFGGTTARGRTQRRGLGSSSLMAIRRSRMRLASQ